MNKLFKFALAALPIVMLASCAKDDLGAEDAIAQESETRYLRVTLTSPTASPASRAGTEEEGWKEENSTTNVVGGKGYYADGTEDENKIRTLEFYFYDRMKQFHSYVPMTISNPPATPDENPRDDTSPNIAAFYHCNVPITLTQGQALPNYVICIVNSVEGTSYQGLTMADAQKKILHELYGAEDDSDEEGNNGKNYFGMSNSVYYGTDEVTGNSGELIMAAPFTTDKLLTESQVATLMDQAGNQGAENQNEIEKFTINIPVERYAAKVRLDLSTVNIDPYPAAPSTGVTLNAETGEPNFTPINLTFTPMKWGVNATERTFFFLKSFRQPGSSVDLDGDPVNYSDIFATETELNSIPLFTGWNNKAHKRCFWARTPGYYNDNYPLTSDDIRDKTQYDASGKPVYPVDERTGKTKYPYDLWYKSWNECQNVNSVNDALAEYVKETTMKKSRLTGEGLPDQYLPTASLPAVILLGQYTVGTETTPKDFYLYGKTGSSTPTVYSDHSSNDKKIEGTGDIRTKMFVDQTIVLYNNSGRLTPVSSETVLNETDKGAFTLMHPSKEVREYAVNMEAATQATTNDIKASALHVAADIVVLQLTKAPTGDLQFYNPRAGRYDPITSDNLTYVNHLLLQNLGGAHYYKNGMAYFSAPIYHWGWYRTNPELTNTEDPDYVKQNNVNAGKTWTEWDWSAMQTGDFGVVRNHVYTMKIGSITGLGNAIANPDDPIVPPADKVSYMVHFHVNIQRWAVLPTQEWNW